MTQSKRYPYQTLTDPAANSFSCEFLQHSTSSCKTLHTASCYYPNEHRNTCFRPSQYGKAQFNLSLQLQGLAVAAGAQQ